MTKLLNYFGLYTQKQMDNLGFELDYSKNFLDVAIKIGLEGEDYIRDLEAILEAEGVL